MFHKAPDIKLFLCCLWLVLFYLPVCGQSNIIGIIDFYGLGKISEKEIRNAININEGDKINYLGKNNQIKKIKTIPGVKQAEISFVCCEEKGQTVVYIGISDQVPDPTTYRKSPTSLISLPKEITETHKKFEKVFVEGIEKGESGEDRSLGHSLMNYPPAREIQEKFIVYASGYLPELKNVLRNSRNAEHRAIATQVIAYVKDKKLIIDDLLYAIEDNDETVRNNATRALALIAAYAGKNPDLNIRKIPADPFIEMMNSVIWTDRNKGAAMLLSLTENRDSAVLKQIKEQSLISIIEMANWKNTGHALMGYLLLGRIAGFSDEEINNVFASENRKSFLDNMVIKLKEN